MLETNLVENQTNLSDESYQEYWDIINEASSKFPYLKEILIKAMRETIEFIEQGGYIDSSCGLVSLELLAGTFEEVSSYCNEIVLKMYDKQQEEMEGKDLKYDEIEDF